MLLYNRLEIESQKTISALTDNNTKLVDAKKVRKVFMFLCFSICITCCMFYTGLCYVIRLNVTLSLCTGVRCCVPL